MDDPIHKCCTEYLFLHFRKILKNMMTNCFCGMFNRRNALTHVFPMIYFHTPWRQQTVRFSDIFRGNRNVTLERNRSRFFFPTGTTVGGSHHRKSVTRREQISVMQWSGFELAQNLVQDFELSFSGVTTIHHTITFLHLM